MTSQLALSTRRSKPSRQHPIIMRDCDLHFELGESDDDDCGLPDVPIEMENCSIRISRTKRRNQGHTSLMLEEVDPPQECTRRPSVYSTPSRRMLEADQDLASRRSVCSAPPRRMPSSYDEEAYFDPVPGRMRTQRRSRPVDDIFNKTAAGVLVGNHVSPGMGAVLGGLAGLTIGTLGAALATDDD